MKNKIAKLTAQQGDVLMQRLTKLPEGQQKKIASQRLVVAHGESGHSHVIEDEDAELIQIGERMILRLENPKNKGPFKNCKLVSETESQFVADLPKLGRVAFSKSTASLKSGKLTTEPFEKLKHEEHVHQAINAGIWEIGRVQEFDYFKMMARQVID